MLDRANHTDIESPTPSLKHFCFFLFREDGEFEREKAKSWVISVCLRENNVTEKSSLFFSRKSKQLTHFLWVLSRKQKGIVWCLCNWLCQNTNPTFVLCCVFTHFQHKVSQPAATAILKLFCIMFAKHFHTLLDVSATFSQCCEKLFIIECRFRVVKTS